MPQMVRSLLRATPIEAERPGVVSRFLAHPSLFLFVVLTAQLMVVLDGTIVNVALPHIQQGLHFSSSGLSWVLNAYVLTFGGLLLLGARAGDLAGRRRTFLIGIALFSISSLLGGVATAAWELVAARAVQGVGAALAAPSSLALLTSVFPEGPQRMRAIGLFTTVSAAGGAVGLLAGGLLTELVSWRWVMFVNVPIGLAVLAFGRLVLTETPRREGHFDLAGAVTSTLGLTGVVFGLVEAGTDGFGRLLTIGPLAIGVALLGAFLRIEARAEEPILPLRLFAHRSRTTANVARGLLTAGMYAMFFFLSQYLQDLQGYSPLRAGLAFLPVPIAVFSSSQVVSRVLAQRIPAKTLMLSGIGLVTTALVLATQIHAGVAYPEVLLMLVLLGVGSGTAFVSLTSAALVDVEPRDSGAASGLINVMQQIGVALGLAVLVSVFGVVTHHAQPGIAGTSSAGLVHGFDEVFAVAAVFGVLALGLVVAAIPPTPRRAIAARIALWREPVPESLEGLELLKAASENVGVSEDELPAIGSIGDRSSLSASCPLE